MALHSRIRATNMQISYEQCFVFHVLVQNCVILLFYTFIEIEISYIFGVQTV
uniref:Uncharacterized protein n=1 Tax=Arundo donax TaxID=35708 RepID=A0A0A9BGB4_ARUDO